MALLYSLIIPIKKNSWYNSWKRTESLSLKPDETRIWPTDSLESMEIQTQWWQRPQYTAKNSRGKLGEYNLLTSQHTENVELESMGKNLNTFI